MSSISFRQSRRSFYRAANAIFGNIGRIATEENVLHLLMCKCIPILLYGLEACPLNKADLHSLDFVVHRFCMKLLKTNNKEFINACQHDCCFRLPSDPIETKKFDSKYNNYSNLLCMCFNLVKS